MLRKNVLCLPGNDPIHSGSFRLGVLGFGNRARDYVARALTAQNNSHTAFEIVVFVSPGSSEWKAARTAASQNRVLSICTSIVTSILPISDAQSSEAQFIVETAQGPYPVDDVFLSRSGGALSTK